MVIFHSYVKLPEGKTGWWLVVGWWWFDTLFLGNPKDLGDDDPHQKTSVSGFRGSQISIPQNPPKESITEVPAGKGAPEKYY